MRGIIVSFMMLMLLLPTMEAWTLNNVPNNKDASPSRRVLIFLKTDPLPADIWDAIIRIRSCRTERELDIARKTLYTKIFSTYEDMFREVKVAIESLSGKVIHEIRSIGAISAYVPSSALSELARNRYVKTIVPVFKVRVLMDIAAKAIYAPDLWALGWNGSNYDDAISGIEVAVVDTGIDETRYLKGRIIDAKSFTTGELSPDDFFGHGTKVAHIIASNDTRYRGIAYGANLINAKALNWEGEGYFDDVMAAIEWALTQARDTAEIINLSIGAVKNVTAGLIPDGSSSLTRLIDHLAFLYDAVFSIAVGNVEGGYEMVNIPADAFNGISVGAMYDRNTVDRSDDILWSGSCHGPTDDGRIKPDVVAPGADIATFTVGGSLDSGSGTSFAAPMVAGSAALIYSYLARRGLKNGSLALATKAAIITAADFWYGDKPNNRTGFGYINLRNVLGVINNTFVINVGAGNRIIYDFNMSSGEEFRVGIVWWRVPKDSTSFYETSTIGLRIIDPQGRVVKEVLESKNNVIKICFQANISGTYTMIIEKLYRENEPLVDQLAISATKKLTGSKQLLVDMPVIGNITDAEVRSLKVVLKNNADSDAENITMTLEANNLELNKTSYRINRLSAGGKMEIPLEATLTAEGIAQIVANATYSLAGETHVITNTSIFLGFDDDTKPPQILSVDVKIDILKNKLSVSVKAEDDSGIESVKMYWRVDYPLDENSLDLADGVLNLTYSAEGDIWRAEMAIKQEWDSKTFYFVIEVRDADNDRPNDSLATYYVGNKQIRTGTWIIILIAIIIVAVAIYLIRTVLLPRLRKRKH